MSDDNVQVLTKAVKKVRAHVRILQGALKKAAWEDMLPIAQSLVMALEELNLIIKQTKGEKSR